MKGETEMSKFNNTVKNTAETKSHEGGTVYQKKDEDLWVNMLFSCMMKPQYYESDEEQQNRFIALTKSMIESHGPLFVAKAAVYSRNVMGLRSISTLCAAMLNDQQFESKRQFYKSYFHRPDDVAELFAAINMLGEKRSHALVRGAADYLSTLNDHKVGKYKLNNKTYNMYDLINITHANSPSIDRYKKGELKLPETWEVMVSSVKCVKEEQEAWRKLVDEGKLGYLALIRNLRNILDCIDDTVWLHETLCSAITNKEAIKQSMVFPYQIYQTYKVNKGNSLQVDAALEQAFLYSIGNMPKLEGNNLVILDVSGSMTGWGWNQQSGMCPLELSSVYAATMLCSDKSSDIICFGDNAELLNVVPYRNSPFKMIEYIAQNHGLGHGTNMASVFNVVNNHYNRMFLFSDMQIADMSSPYARFTGSNVNALFNNYIQNNGKCHMYSFDLGSYSTQVLKHNGNLTYISALNDKVFKFIELEENGDTLIDVINGYSF